MLASGATAMPRTLLSRPGRAPAPPKLVPKARLVESKRATRWFWLSATNSRPARSTAASYGFRTGRDRSQRADQGLEGAAGVEALDAVVAVVGDEDVMVARRVDREAGDDVELSGARAARAEDDGRSVRSPVGTEMEALHAVVVLVADVEVVAEQREAAVDAGVELPRRAAERPELALELASWAEALDARVERVEHIDAPVIVHGQAADAAHRPGGRARAR